MNPRDDRIDPPQLTDKRLGFLIGVPLAWAVLLWFHPGGDGDVIYTSLRDEVTAWQIVHVGTLVFIGLMGIALYMLVQDLPGEGRDHQPARHRPVRPVLRSLGGRHRPGHRRAGPTCERCAAGSAARRVGRHPEPAGQRHRGRSRRIRHHRGPRVGHGGGRGGDGVPPRSGAGHGLGAPRTFGGGRVAPAADRADRPGVLRRGGRSPRHQPTGLPRDRHTNTSIDAYDWGRHLSRADTGRPADQFGARSVAKPLTSTR
jgi:hypothetical protein